MKLKDFVPKLYGFKIYGKKGSKYYKEGSKNDLSKAGIGKENKSSNNSKDGVKNVENGVKNLSLK